MAGVNKAIIVGFLGRDPELTYTPNGSAVCKLSVATSRRYTDKQGNAKEETEWHRVTAWGKTAESCNTYLRKGSQVYIEGRLKTSKYEKDGHTHYSTTIEVDVVQFLGGKADDGGGERRDVPGRSRRASAPEQQSYDEYAQAPSADPSDDDIPF